MGKRKLYVGLALVLSIVLLGLAVGLWGGMVQVQGASLVSAQTTSDDPLILSYSAKFVCLEPLQPGQLSYSKTAPIVKEQTEVLIHNPNDFPIVFYKKAVRAPLEGADPIDPGAWEKIRLKPDHAVRVNCDEIAKLLTGKAGATFIGTYGIGVKVEGFVVVAVGPQTVTAAGDVRYSPLDVTAEYSRSSEVLKKDISYQPWWRYWWWNLPWRLGYPYERLIALDPTNYEANIDCRAILYDQLKRDVEGDSKMTDPEKDATSDALGAGIEIDPTSIMLPEHTGADSPAALVAMIGRCDKIVYAGIPYAAVDYVLLSNKGYTDLNPLQPTTDIYPYPYPWIPGRWHDLTVVMPQNVTKDLDDYMHTWHTELWLAAGADKATVNTAMRYYFPYWCGWGYWWWWWHGADCIDIGVGEGESIDVEQVTPVRVFMSQWPPTQ